MDLSQVGNREDFESIAPSIDIENQDFDQLSVKKHKLTEGTQSMVTLPTVPTNSQSRSTMKTIGADRSNKDFRDNRGRKNGQKPDPY